MMNSSYHDDIMTSYLNAELSIDHIDNIDHDDDMLQTHLDNGNDNNDHMIVNNDQYNADYSSMIFLKLCTQQKST